MMTKVVVFTPTWLEADGEPVIRRECRVSVEEQVFDGAIEWEIGTYNPWPGRQMRNVVAQYQRGRESFLNGDGDVWLTFEHDMALPDADAVQRLWDTMERTGAGVVYGVYMLRHGAWVLNAWEYIGDHALGESLTLYPAKLASALLQGVARVCGVGWGCTLIRRDVVERFPVRGGDDGAGDLPFAYDCLYAGVMAVADFSVCCDHWDGELRLRAFGGRMSDTVRVLAMQDVVVMDGQGSRRLTRGQVYELGRTLVSDLMRAGYVTEVPETPEPETAAVVAPERTVMTKGRRKRVGGES